MESPFSSSLDQEPEQELLADGDNLGPQEKIPNSYDAFMKKHLQHYGYYTGQNTSYRENFRSLQEWKKNYDVRLSGQHDLSIMEEHFGRSGPFPAKLLDMPSVFSAEGAISDELLHRTTQLVFHYQAGRKIPKLREPRNLYALTKEAGPQQATRWPSHLQVVCPAIRFIEYTPPIPAPMYEPTGREPTPAVRGPQMGEMIYYNDPGRDLYFMRSRVAGCRLAMRTTPPPREYPDDHLTLEFESRFESGNLLKVDKITDYDYELTLRTDLYTNKHTQWFFFRVRNMRPEKTYRFTIINLMKPSSLYNQGMKPVWYSEINAKKNKIGWVRIGNNIRYYRNNMCGRDGRSYYSLTWSCEFPYKDDCCYFAHCFPYTYSDLQEYLLQLANDPVRSRFCKQRVLTRTLAGNLVYILTITSPSRNPEISRSKRAVVVTSRVHPGETNASWMMKGFLDYLTSSSADAKLLRDTFIFKIVPMLNPDGVIVGNYRCSLAGRDLNRNYKSVLKDSFPSIWHTKMMIKRLNAERQVVVYCDLHGHSRKNNIFIYGCENKHDRSKRLQERVFPLMLAKNASQVFSFDSCKYKVQKSKEGTGRIVVWCMGIMNSYTMEATFGGTSLPGERKNTHLSARDLETMGYHFCDTLLDYCDPDSSKVEACMRELQDYMKRQILKRLQLQNPNLTDVNLDDYGSDFESDTSGSDSSCDDGLPVHLLAIAPKLQRKKKLRTKRDKAGKISSSKPSSNPSANEKQISNQTKLYSDKVKSLRYSQSVSNIKRRDERQPAATTIVSTMANDTSNDKSSKKSEYLEALTSAYIRSGVLMVPENVQDYSLRYTTGEGKRAQDGTFAVKYLSNHLDRSSDDESDEALKPNSPPLMRNASCQWSPQPGSSPVSSGSEDEESVNKDAILAEEQYELLRQSALRRQLSADQQQLLAKKHLVAVAAMQKRNEENQRVSSARSCFDVASKRSAITEEMNECGGPDAIPMSKSSAHLESESSSSLSPYPNAGRQSASGGRKIRPRSSTGLSPAMLASESVANMRGTLTRSHTNPPNHNADSGENITDSVKSAKQEDNDVTVKENKKRTPRMGRAEAIGGSSTLFEDSDPLTINTAGSARSDKNSTVSKHFFTKTKTEADLNLPKNGETLSSKTKDQLSGLLPDDSPMKISSKDVPKHDIHPSSARELHKNENDSADVEPGITSSRSNPPFHEKLNRSFSVQQSADKGGLGLGGENPSLPVHANSLLNLARPSAPRNVHQPDTKCMVKGEILLPKSSDKPTIPGGIKKANAVVMEPETDNLTIQNSRSYIIRNSASESYLDSNQKHKYKFYQNSEDTFFGMSDQIGLGVMPRNARVPPVVANIAELRRSLMGQGREASENSTNRPESFRRVVSHNASGRNPSEGFSGHEESLQFSQRPRRRNPMMMQSSRRTDENFDRETSEKPNKKKSNETREIIPEAIPASPLSDESFSDEDIENASTVATLSGPRRNHTQHHMRRRQRREPGKSDPALFSSTEKQKREQSKSESPHLGSNERQKRELFGKIDHQPMLSYADSFLDDNYATTSRSDLEGRKYTQGNATIEKTSDHSMTNIRIGSRTASRPSANDQWFETQPREGSNVSSRLLDSRQHAVSAVSLNMKGDEERMCVTTPALASRPVPPLLRYLSAKQGMNKRK